MFISFKTSSMVHSLVISSCPIIEIFNHQNGFGLSLYVTIECRFDFLLPMAIKFCFDCHNVIKCDSSD
jgi:hypothetical protein